MSRVPTTRHYPRAIAMLIGTIVGVGIFGVPYVVAKSGLTIGFVHFVVLTVVVLLVHLSFGEITLRTTAHHRLVGFAGLYLGKPGKAIASLSGVLGMYGALLAYLIVVGTFLEQILGPIFGGSATTYSVIFAVLAALAVLRGVHIIEELEFILTAFIFIAIALIAIVGLQRVDPVNWSGASLEHAFLPYGVILFSLGGVSAIAELRDILRGRERLLPRAIAWGTVLSAILTLVFALVVVGVSGAQTSQESIIGLAPTLGQSIVILGALLGFLTIATSHLMLSLYAREVYEYDFHLPRWAAFLLAVVAPVLIFLFGHPEFIEVIMVTGAIFAGLDGILVALIALVARKRGDRVPEFSVRLPAFVYGLVVLVFVAGIIVTIRDLL